MQLTHVIKKPIITERSMALVKGNQFSFLVDKRANKEMIKKAIEKTFNVTVTAVDTVVQKGKTKRIGVRRVEKVISPFKKAIVKVKTGQKIDIFDLGV